MRLLITGGSGLLGSKLTRIAVQRGYETYSTYNAHDLNFGIPVKLDICNKKNVKKSFNEIKPEAVIHAAALTNVDKCEVERNLARKVNIEGTKNIIESSKNNNAFLVFISTDYVFSGEKELYKETDEPKPINYYGITKFKAEKLIKASNVEWCIARPSVIFGSSPASGKINFALWILDKLKNRDTVKIITDQWVSPTLNTNLAEMTLEIIERTLSGLYHLAGATPINRYEFATLIAETFHLNKNLIIPTTSKEMKWLAKRPKNTSLNIEKAQITLKNKPLKIKDALTKLKEEINI